MYRGDSTRILILGDGLLGSEIQKQTGWDLISRNSNMFEFTTFHNDPKWIEVLNGYDVIVNCIANTDTYSGVKGDHWEINYQAVHKLIEVCNEHDIKLVHIGTDYMFANNKNHNATEEDVPVHSEHWYSYTKLLADGLVQLLSNNYLICRCTHKAAPFNYQKAFIDRIGNFDYTHVIAELIVKLIKADESGVYNVGTERKSIYQLAMKTNPNVEISFVPEGYPKDTSFSVEKLNNFLKHNN